ncbi:hypothetical protein GCM10019071_40570 [Sphingobium fuliginis]|uniref:Mobile element protein n=1 Tax=Sphingobium fuliginis (strain ATCC 27551) TaxID=336203 RepID=A0ABQ1FCC7_SPHSA|nr:hypothetical protein GCM10019071_40570 [Sphingobium fuliginis]
MGANDAGISHQTRESSSSNRETVYGSNPAKAFRSLLDVLERRPDLCDEDPPRMGERDAARGTVEQPHRKLSLELANRIAYGRCRYAKVQRRRAKRAAPHDGKNGL